MQVFIPPSLVFLPPSLAGNRRYSLPASSRARISIGFPNLHQAFYDSAREPTEIGANEPGNRNSPASRHLRHHWLQKPHENFPMCILPHFGFPTEEFSCDLFTTLRAFSRTFGKSASLAGNRRYSMPGVPKIS